MKKLDHHVSLNKAAVLTADTQHGPRALSLKLCGEPSAVAGIPTLLIKGGDSAVQFSVLRTVKVSSGQ